MPIPKLLLICLLFAACAEKKDASMINNEYADRYRPQIHFSPKTGWMNDPNGMVYLNGTYHLFYQHYPDSTVWGPMHWGHATSADLVHWVEQPIALYPDSLGYIFSGSAVVDKNNTSGFGKDGKAPLVAIFTHHDPKGEKAGSMVFQNQSIAFSLDEGKTWTKYAGNPVVNNPGIRDFRDPKVRWFEAGKKWIMTLAAKDHISFYSSPDLKTWTLESDFGNGLGSHGGVWECPDLFPLTYQGRQVWVLIVSIGSGGPNGGSATQYFTGMFDGKTFIANHTDTRWIDYGPDNYAGITWSNTGDRCIFLGWMSNWQYANLVPTEKWRSAMTIPRELGLQKVGEQYLVTSLPVKELDVLAEEAISLNDIPVEGYDLAKQTGPLKGPFRLTITSDTAKSFSLTLSNTQKEQLVIGYDKAANQYYIDRTNAGINNFEKGFAGRHIAPRLITNGNQQVTLYIDAASVELFADGGLTVMTAIFFPKEDYTSATLQSADGLVIKNLSFNHLKEIW